MPDGFNLQRIEELSYELLAAKIAEMECVYKRVDAENSIAALVPTGDIGQKTVTLPGGTKVTVKRGLNYKADVQAVEGMSCWDGLTYPAPIKVKTTRELDEKGYEWIRENDPFTFQVISSHITVTPKKVAVSIKVKQ